MSWTQWLFAVLIIFVCGFLMLVVLLQRGRGGGLAGAFGGAGGTAAFGAKTGDVFTWITVVVAAVFLLVCVLANYAFDMAPLPATVPQVTSQVPVSIPGSDTSPAQGTQIMPFKVEPGAGGDGTINLTPIDMPAESATEAAPAEAPEIPPGTDTIQPVDPQAESAIPQTEPVDDGGDPPAEEDKGPGSP
jgi:preprotein translocase subunit SecG